MSIWTSLIKCEVPTSVTILLVCTGVCDMIDHSCRHGVDCHELLCLYIPYDEVVKLCKCLQLNNDMLIHISINNVRKW